MQRRHSIARFDHSSSRTTICAAHRPSPSAPARVARLRTLQAISQAPQLSVMDIFEHSDAVWPTRSLQQEDEEQAVPTAAASLEPPTVQASATKPSVLVVACSSDSSLLLEHCFPGRQAVGSIQGSVESLATAGGSADAEGSQIYSSEAGGADVLLVPGLHKLPAEKANTWARALLAELQPARVLLLGAVQGENYTGEGDPSQDSLVFLLQTEAARAKQGAAAGPAPYLPTGTVIGGLLAAVLSYCQVRELPAEALVSVDMVRLTAAANLEALAKAAAAALQAAGSGAAAGRLGDAVALAQAGQHLQKHVEHSSIYV